MVTNRDDPCLICRYLPAVQERGALSYGRCVLRCMYVHNGAVFDDNTVVFNTLTSYTSYGVIWLKYKKHRRTAVPHCGSSYGRLDSGNAVYLACDYLLIYYTMVMLVFSTTTHTLERLSHTKESLVYRGSISHMLLDSLEEDHRGK
jgi:hypothetical protein